MSLAVFAWGALRLYGLLRQQTLWRVAVGPTWEVVAAVLSGCAAVVVMPAEVDAAMTLSGWLLIAACEFLLGSVVGVLISLPGHALLAATGQSGECLNVQRGGLVALLAIACLAGGLAVGLHHPLLVGLQQQLTQWSLGEPARWWPALAGLDARVIVAANGYLVLAFTLATPVLLSVAVVDLTLRLTSRGVASAPGDALRPWLASTAALVALGGAWAAYPEAWQRAWGAV